MTLKQWPAIGTDTRRLVMRLTALMLLMCGLSANAQEPNRLQDIQVQSLPGQRVELKLILSGTGGHGRRGLRACGGG